MTHYAGKAGSTCQPMMWNVNFVVNYLLPKVKRSYNYISKNVSAATGSSLGEGSESDSSSQSEVVIISYKHQLIISKCGHIFSENFEPNEST